MVHLDEPRCTPCSLASKSTSHHELSALPEMLLNLKDFAANLIKLSTCTFPHVITTLFTRQSSHCSDLYDTTRSSNQVCVCCRVSSQPNSSSPKRIIFVRDAFSLQPVTSFTKLHQMVFCVTPLLSNFRTRSHHSVCAEKSVQQPSGVSQKPRHALMSNTDD